MPLYEYRCHACGKTLEVLRKFSDDPLTVHEGCGGELEQLISTSALQFKGTGWYVTDYAKGHSAPPASNGKSEGKSDGDASKSEGKSETKTETSKPAGESKKSSD